MGSRRRGTAISLRLLLTLALTLVGLTLPTVTATAAADPCAAPVNVIACENSQPGTPQSVWDITGAGDPGLQGFATNMSVNAGSTISFKIKTTASNYSISVYRLGWYAGNGARKVANVKQSVPLPQTQPACVDDPSTGLYDCGTWRVSASWPVPSTAVSGVYIALLRNPNNGDQSHITFVVRNDSSQSAIVFQTSDTTWQAYNPYGGTNLYYGPRGRATKVSYNRPFATRGVEEGRDFLFSNEFPMLQFLERNGYDISYISGLDTDRRGPLLKNHKVFLSVGHDEYWSGQQRTNVEAARDAGVNLAFFSGNEVYWKTRWEPSVDGTSTDGRTLVAYKETLSNAKVDPSNEWTGTWRDPRFSPPSDGGRPENALTGTAYMSNNTDLPITVSEREGKLRLWRNTGLASMTDGQSTALARSTVGYESDEDLDNGFRPEGLIRLSTTTGPTPQYLRDYGSTVTPGTTTHHLTMYRAPSGALVFGAGTIQWAWGLSIDHDGAGAAADPRIQQATVNLLADMSAQPTTLMAGLAPASASTDTAGPTTVITSPAAGSTIANGTKVTVTGTASDAAGRVAGVEVSTDGGVSWHPADGLTSWTYSYTQTGVGTVTLRARAADDSARIGAAATASVSVTCPCSLFGSGVPVTASTSDTSGVELGMRFTAQEGGYVSSVRFYKGLGNTGIHTGTIWAANGTALSSGTFTNETATGWQTLKLAVPVEVMAGTTYIASYYAPNGRYSADANFFTAKDHLASPLKAAGRPSGELNGVYRSGRGFPVSSYGDTNYWVDVLFTTTATTPPVVSVQSPLAGATSVAATAKPSARFSTPVDPSSVTVDVMGTTGQAVPGAVSFDATTRTATFAPTSALARGTTYTVTARATSQSGVPMPAPSTWSFTTAKPSPEPGVCPCSLWDDAATPASVTWNDNKSVELGVKFVPDVAGRVTGIRFYKGPQNTGTHTGSLWSSGGTLLASATFSSESSTGWQTVTFSSPVDVSAGATYVASYRAPEGYYSLTAGGLSSAVEAVPLRTLAGGGVYTYATGFPSNSSGANYWTDVVFTATDAAPAAPDSSPDDGTTNVQTAVQPSAKFAGLIQSGTARIALQGPGGTPVTGTSTYASATRTITFSPASALEEGRVYTATVSGAKALSGAQMAPYSWSFTTAGVTACPCTLFDSSTAPSVGDAGDASAIELGVAFVPQVDGRVTGVRFYKSAANTGTHVGTLWGTGGSRLASVTFSGESASGWQTASFSTPVPVTAGTRYVVSYFAPNGRYAGTSRFFDAEWSSGPLRAPAGGNGLYRYGSGGFPTGSYAATNYWVDPVFTLPPSGGSAPEVVATSPLSSASSVPATVRPSATFAVAVDASTITFGLKDAGGVSVTGATSYDAAAKTATFTPSVNLARGGSYTASVRAASPTGAAMDAPATWSFTTAQPSPVPGVCPCGIWDDGATPQTVTANDAGNVELGVKFTADVNGKVTGVRFYKGPENVGIHTGSLWSASGALLATTTFSGESSTGWQTASFSTPVDVTAGTTYFASYRAPGGRYSVDSGGLAGVVEASPLRTVASGGAYTYSVGFPSNSTTANYWVDVIFTRTG